MLWLRSCPCSDEGRAGAACSTFISIQVNFGAPQTPAPALTLDPHCETRRARSPIAVTQCASTSAAAAEVRQRCRQQRHPPCRAQCCAPNPGSQAGAQTRQCACESIRLGCALDDASGHAMRRRGGCARASTLHSAKHFKLEGGLRLGRMHLQYAQPLTLRMQQWASNAPLRRPVHADASHGCHNTQVSPTHKPQRRAADAHPSHCDCCATSATTAHAAHTTTSSCNTFGRHAAACMIPVLANSPGRRRHRACSPIHLKSRLNHATCWQVVAA